MCVWTLFLNLYDGDSSFKGYCTQSILANNGNAVFSLSAGWGNAARIVSHLYISINYQTGRDISNRMEGFVWNGNGVRGGKDIIRRFPKQVVSSSKGRSRATTRMDEDHQMPQPWAHARSRPSSPSIPHERLPLPRRSQATHDPHQRNHPSWSRQYQGSIDAIHYSMRSCHVRGAWHCRTCTPSNRFLRGPCKLQFGKVRQMFASGY